MMKAFGQQAPIQHPRAKKATPSAVERENIVDLDDVDSAELQGRSAWNTSTLKWIADI